MTQLFADTKTFPKGVGPLDYQLNYCLLRYHWLTTMSNNWRNLSLNNTKKISVTEYCHHCLTDALHMECKSTKHYSVLLLQSMHNKSIQWAATAQFSRQNDLRKYQYIWTRSSFIYTTNRIYKYVKSLTIILTVRTKISHLQFQTHTTGQASLNRVQTNQHRWTHSTAVGHLPPLPGRRTSACELHWQQTGFPWYQTEKKSTKLVSVCIIKLFS